MSQANSPSPNATPSSLGSRDQPTWVVFCRVIDNLGDIGVCWRLCSNLAQHGIRVELWIDVPDDLSWMAPGALEGAVTGITVHHWAEPLDAGQRIAAGQMTEADVWIEAFGCNPPDVCLAALAELIAKGRQAPVWLNLEYMSAESYVERCHRLPSPIMTGPLVGVTKHFFYPGFTSRTGGLLREADLMERQAHFQATHWMNTRLGLQPSEVHRALMFCYAPEAMQSLLSQWNSGAEPVECLVTPGWASDAVDEALGEITASADGQLTLKALPYVTQPEFDQLLWSTDFNFVRGEDSLVRALWAGKPFVWQIYPQDDGAHHAKLEAFLDWLDAPDSWRAFHRQWNGIGDDPLRWPGWDEVQRWQSVVLAARDKLLRQDDLATQLMGFVSRLRQA
ncbi:elongation factor P maturation arginine rhamnosyltransferase EarP [Hydrogenophaga sp. 5NK40-0174]|uniref:elongation factor P maturation arginine rhamnosyltransferase EarP n=1 Tax=Hydrogenophaga sp. 5NK40-0174 TaxID=3127649 RepID=UPI003106A539